ncbi:MAG: O-antigen ligase family protein [Nitrospinae bacterium]|nr:O-antigen ligase family protein [Nitrospinota bacterium]
MILKICDWIIFYSLILIVTLTPLVINPWGDDQFRLPKEVFAQVMIIIAFSSWLIKLIEEGFSLKRIVRKTPFMLPISLLILASMLSLFNTTSVLFSFKSILNIILYSLLYIVIVNNVKRYRQIKILLISALLSGIITSIYCFVQYFGFDPITHTVNPVQPNVGSYRTTGFLDNLDIVSGYLIIFPTVVLSMFLASAKLALRILFFSAFLLITSITIIIHSIATIFGLFAAFLVFMVFVKPHLPSKVKIGLAVILISFIGAGFFSGKVESIFNSASSHYKRFQDLSSDRLLMWRTAGEMIKDKPVSGIGMGMYKVKFFEYRDKVFDKIPYFGVYEKAEQAHNEYLQIWAEMGTIGIVAVIWLIIGYLTYTFKSKIQNPKSKIKIIGLTSGVIAILIDAIGSFPFHIAPSAVLTVVLIALTVSLQISGECRVMSDEFNTQN